MREFSYTFILKCHVAGYLLLKTLLGMGFSNYYSKSSHFPPTVNLLIIHHLPCSIETTMKSWGREWRHAQARTSWIPTGFTPN